MLLAPPYVLSPLTVTWMPAAGKSFASAGQGLTWPGGSEGPEGCLPGGRRPRFAFGVEGRRPERLAGRARQRGLVVDFHPQGHRFGYRLASGVDRFGRQRRRDRFDREALAFAAVFRA